MSKSRSDARKRPARARAKPTASPISDLCPRRCFVVGSKDMSTWVFGAERWANLIYYSLGGHKDLIVGCFFEKDSLDVSSRGQMWFSG